MAKFTIYYEESGTYKAKKSFEVEAESNAEAVTKAFVMERIGELHDLEYDYERADFNIY